jgi:hypothetical protein
MVMFDLLILVRFFLVMLNNEELNRDELPIFVLLWANFLFLSLSAGE